MKIDLSKLITAEAKADAAKAVTQAVAEASARAYLAETDWYVVRLAETGKSVPTEIQAERAKARLVVQKAENANDTN